ncbi:flagellar brake domain-containing protein [Pseudoalteromonas luteoviolacea]|nr:flagellar brake protein [Pseudoalteromonas luteoviolacea]MBQ4879776.1 flagellar brake protein [Pseudoalteromonas luteoviolacea]MBQ4908838.1 flagellar brake protein [Pseudoalteromonas luteoviolacea]
MTIQELAENRLQVLQMRAGSIVDMEIVLPANRKRIKTEFVGALENQFIILNHPSHQRLGAAMDYVKEGTEVIVRALPEEGDGQIIAFKETIKSVTTHPARLIYLYYPNEVQTYKLRAQTRIPTLIPAVLNVEGKSEVGVIKDISLAGLMFDVQKTHLPEELKELSCEILIEGKDAKKLTLVGKVCRVKENQEEIVSLGIHLESQDKQVQAILKDYLIDISVLGNE